MNERGSAMVLAIFVLVLLASLGAALLFLSQSEMGMTRAHADGKRAFQLAESGLEDGRMTLFDTNGDGPFSDDLETAGGANGVIDFDPATLQATFDADGNVTGLSGYGDDAPLRTLTQFGDVPDGGWYAAFLTNDPVEDEATVVDANLRVMVTGVGFATRRSMEAVQAIVEPFKPIPDVPPAAITLLGPPPDFDNGSSAAQSHDGNDCRGSGVPGLYVPIVGAIGGPARDDVQSDMERPEKFESGPFTGEDTIGDLTDPTDPIVGASGLGTIDPAWTDCDGLKAMVLDLIERADYYCNTDVTSCVIPATSPGDITVIDGDLDTPGHTTHTGLLLVTGVLTYNGTSEWNGIIMAVGEGHVERAGGGTGNPSGALIVANIDPSPNGPRADKSDWCTGSADGFEEAEYDTHGSGNSTVNYCSLDIDSANPVRTYRVVEFLQR